MIDDNRDRAAPTLTVGSLAEWHAAASRRTFLRLVGLGGVLALLPSFATACGSDPTTAPSDGVAGSGNPVIIDQYGNYVQYDEEGNVSTFDAEGNLIGYDEQGNVVILATAVVRLAEVIWMMVQGKAVQ